MKTDLYKLAMRYGYVANSPFPQDGTLLEQLYWYEECCNNSSSNRAHPLRIALQEALGLIEQLQAKDIPKKA